jgi:hypothetical protein
MIRGTISELIAGDKVTIVTLGGETRSYPMGQVKFAGPAARMSEATEPPKPPPPEAAPPSSETKSGDPRPMVTVRGQEARLKLGGAGLTFHRPSASAIGTGGIAKGYEVMCSAPCEVSMPAGSYRFALSRDGGIPTESPDAVTVPPGESSVDAELVDRSGTRTLGLVVGVGGAVLGAAIPFTVLTKEECIGTSEPICSDRPSTAGWVLGGAVMAAGLIGGLTMSFTHDKVTITVRPGAPDSPAAGDAKLQSASARVLDLNGLSIDGAF